MLRRLSILVLLGVLAFFASGPAWARTAITGVRGAEHPDGVTRFVLDMSQATGFRLRLASNPDRVIIDTEPLEWVATPLFRRAVGAIEAIHYADEPEGGRLVLFLRQPSRIKQAFVLSPRENAGWRFVVDLKGASRQEFMAGVGGMPLAITALAPMGPAGASPEDAAAAVPPPAQSSRIVVMSPAVSQRPVTLPLTENPAEDASASPATAPDGAMRVETASKGGPLLSAPMPPPPPRPGATPAVAVGQDVSSPFPVTKVAVPAPAPQPEPKKRGDSRPMIVIDPGHGGIDPGATGVSGIYEKNITLAVARELRRHLERTGRYRVHLTRDRDIFIPLRGRVAIARQYKADLFISLHADVVKDPQIRGLSVYTLSQTASDAEAQSLADNENKVDLIAGIDLSHESADVANILIDLAQRETMNSSVIFASDLVEELGREISLLTNTHRFAGFAVLKAPDVPAVLIETGYLSNRSEERSLRRPEYRSRLARAITRAVNRFFLQTQRGRRS